MELNEYQIQAGYTSGNVRIADAPYLYPALGLANEAGEVLGKVKKIFRDESGVMTAERVHELCSELGDVLWYLAEMARQLGIPLEQVATTNLEKLASRKTRGVIGGSGDSR